MNEDYKGKHNENTKNFIDKMVNWNKVAENEKKQIKTVMSYLIEKEGLLFNEIFDCKDPNCEDDSYKKSY